MLPLVDKPILQYGIEEALGSGLDKLVIVSSKGKDAIFDHFDRTSELERSLRDRGKNDLLAEVDAVGVAVRRCDAACIVRELAHTAASLLPPVIAIPSCSSVTLGSYSPTIRPS
jgi:UTP-glucose-1-phosphate uridylyltransferase